MCPGKGAVVKLRNGPNQEAAGIETEAEGTKDKSQVCQGPQPLQRLPSPARSLGLCIHMWLSILRSPLWHYRLRRHFLTPFAPLPLSFKKSYSIYTWNTQPVPSVCTHMCGYVQSPEDTLWWHFSGTVHFILFESASHWPGICKRKPGWLVSYPECLPVSHLPKLGL